MTAYAHLTGQSVPVAIGTGFTVMDKSNIDNPDVAKFLYKE
jgi:ribose transport system substrate-binding protein